jgi:hypothetical protein
MRKLSLGMIKWFDLEFKDHADPTNSLSVFAKEFDTSSDEAQKLYKVWWHVEDHRNWYTEFCNEEECDEESSSWE